MVLEQLLAQISSLRSKATISISTALVSASSEEDLGEQTNLLSSSEQWQMEDHSENERERDRPKRTAAALMMIKLRAVKRRTKPWHWWTALAAAVVIAGVVLAAVLVTRRNHEKAVQEDKNVRQTLVVPVAGGKRRMLDAKYLDFLCADPVGSEQRPRQPGLCAVPGLARGPRWRGGSVPRDTIRGAAYGGS